MSEPIIVLTTIGSDEQGRGLAHDLVSRRLAACVSVVPGLTSVYRWAGRVDADPEVLLLIKTTTERREELKAHLVQVHPYEVPEFIVVPVRGVAEPYLRWLMDSVGDLQEGDQA